MHSLSLQTRSLIQKIQNQVSLQKKTHLKAPSNILQYDNQFLFVLNNLHKTLKQQYHLSNQYVKRPNQKGVQFTDLIKKTSFKQKKQVSDSKQIPYSSCNIPAVIPKKKAEAQSPLKKTLQKKIKLTYNKSLVAYYRYHIISLCALIGKKQDYMASLRIKKTESIFQSLTLTQIQQKLKKQIQSKGRDKGRLNFNIMANDQLRSLKYKKKFLYIYNNPFRKKQSLQNTNEKKQDKQQQQDQQQQFFEKQQKIDNATWRKRNGVRPNQKVFVIKGGYHDMRKALLDRGWFQNEDVWSPFYDFKWTTRINDVQFYRLSANQIVNHFNNNQGLTSKFGLARNLRKLILAHNIDVDKFFPRCYDIGDQIDFENFIQNFKFGFAETVVRRFLVQPQRYHNLELKMRIAIDILQRRLKSLNQKIQLINTSNYFMISPQQWGIITQTTQLPQQILAEKLKFYCKDQIQNPQNQEYQSKIFQKFKMRIINALNSLKSTDPQIDMNGYHNIWIAKPNYLSRGRGIRCFNNLFDIVDYCFGKDIQYVIQKYIENPLIIHHRKFDIRQWVLIQDFKPPKIWFYEQCYIRFCTETYSLENINNRFIHLTNNSIQKYNSKFYKSEIPGNMWSMKQFSDHIGPEKWKDIQQKMKNIIVWSIRSCQGQIAARKNSCQLVGYDFMIDQHYNPWLIQINMSPSMDYSTNITKRLVKAVMQDTIKVLVDSKKKKDTGMFSCIYKGENNQNYNLFKI